VRRIAALFLAILFIASSAINVGGQSDEKIILIEEDIDYSGPFWYSISCLEINCPGLTLEINDGMENNTLQNEHVLEWSGILNAGSKLTVLSNSDVSVSDISTKMIKVDNLTMIEKEDLIDIIPSPGNQGDYPTIVTSDVCILGNCASNIQESQRRLDFVGILDNYTDKDSIRIFGEHGDIIEISDIEGDGNIKIEVWLRDSDEKKMIFNNLIHSENHFLEYPQDAELWLRVSSDSNKELNSYKFTTYRNNQSKEAPLGGELSVPWSHGEALTYQDSLFYESYLSESDIEGDSLLFKIGSDTKIGLECLASNIETNFEIYLIDFNGDIENISLVDGTCPEVIQSAEDTDSIELIIKSEKTGRWNISFTQIQPLDGGSLADAPESRWLEYPDNRWSLIGLDIDISGSLHLGDNVDIYLIRILDLNGSRIYLNELIKSEVNYTIQEIDQENGNLVNTSNGETIVLPSGNHSLRIERRADLGVEVDYLFKLEYLGEYKPLEPVNYEDLSWMFDTFYKLIGVLMLSPLMVVIFWNRKTIMSRKKRAIGIQSHDKKRLLRIRERLSEQLKKEDLKDEKLIDLALEQLGESPWNSINEVWGKPILTHMTEEIEICAWKIVENNKNLLLGIKVGNWEWTMAAMRIHFPEGSKLTITDISPKHLFQDDEIFLGTMEKHTQIFIRLSMTGESANLALQLSGLVNDKPLAAVPNKVINW
jgi:hypothetical protein